MNAEASAGMISRIEAVSDEALCKSPGGIRTPLPALIDLTEALLCDLEARGVDCGPARAMLSSAGGVATDVRARFAVYLAMNEAKASVSEAAHKPKEASVEHA